MRSIGDRSNLPFPLGRNKSQIVYDAILRMIMVGELQSGAQMAESQLADEFACSQATVRDALMRLQEDGLVQRAGYRGTTLCRIDQREADEMLAIRIRLEGQGAGYAASMCQPADIADLEALVSSMEEAAGVGDSYRLRTEDAAFHLRLFSISGLKALEPILRRCLLYNQRAKMAETANEIAVLKNTATRHRTIVEALKSASASGLREALEQHILTIGAALPAPRLVDRGLDGLGNKPPLRPKA